MNTIWFAISGFSIQVQIPPHSTISYDGVFPKNFGAVNKNLFRGSWPNASQLNTMQESLGIRHLVSLHSRYGSESLELAHLRQIVPHGMAHQEVEVQTALSFIAAAQRVIELTEPVYVHCNAGANRTGKTILIAQILKENSCGRVVKKDQLQLLLAQALAYGFDFNKSYKHVLEEALEILLLQGRIQLNPE